MYGNQCFEASMEDTPEWTCDCPVECKSISYSFSIVSTPLGPEESCPPHASWRDGVLMSPFYEQESPPKFVKKLIDMRNNISHDFDYDEMEESCKKNLQYRAEVIFRLATDSMSVTIMSRRLSFFDKLSAFGNDIGDMFNTLNIMYFQEALLDYSLGSVSSA